MVDRRLSSSRPLGYALWDAHSIYDEYSDPLAAAKHHASLTSDDEEDTLTRDAAQLAELTGVVTAQP
ncbi:hypothetical protein BPC006_I2427 [Burkholderia pseudomallei BPC006]|nr:hypothetical protein BPC006_I2427 [Burkholderia pseudomallei BPC006]